MCDGEWRLSRRERALRKSGTKLAGQFRNEAHHVMLSWRSQCRASATRHGGLLATVYGGLRPHIGRGRDPTTRLMPAVPRRLLIGSHSLCTTRLSHPACCAPLVRSYAQQPDNPSAGTTLTEPNNLSKSRSPFYFEAGYALFAKRPSRPFPPPFLSYPSGSFSDPLSTHDKVRDKRPSVNGEIIRGITNGDDAVLVSDYFIGTNDGVGAWATREKGHAA